MSWLTASACMIPETIFTAVLVLFGIDFPLFIILIHNTYKYQCIILSGQSSAEDCLPLDAIRQNMAYSFL